MGKPPTFGESRLLLGSCPRIKMSTSSAAPAPLSDQPLRGLALIVGATMLFAYSDTTNKLLVTDYNVPLVMAVRYITHALLMIAIVAPFHGRTMVRATRKRLVLLRGGCLAIASVLMGFALQRMPVAEATAIVYLAPVLVILLSGPLLNEKVGSGAWIAAALGFSGVLLIARPGGGLDPWGIAFALGNVVLAVGYNLLSRVLARTEHTITMLFYTALVGSILFGLLLPWTLYGAVPTPLQVFLFVGLGVSAGLGHYLFTQSYRYAPAAILAPMNYLHLGWAALFGWLVFGHAPDPIAMAGIGLVAAAGIVSATMARKRPPPAREEAAATPEEAG
ncbi:Threonine/homoserine efflux transporter RhtA [Devosia crocina]|uniref:Threonine/homoserine efflux transporter RhtA n=2 Tax=Devosia crocina TaxID=429728 RepID=A0A1I7NJT9_9HYPH|nr:Threonine/homoserine efflux transporter RhtA [Devosia crocina]